MGIGDQFIKETRYTDVQITSDQMKGIQVPPVEKPPSNNFITLPDPNPDTIQKIDLSVAIESRESVREYADLSLTIDELSYLLWCTAGIKWEFSEGAFRNVPSSGCRHAIDTYLVIRGVNDLKPGLYRYIALDHGLEVVKEDDTIPDKVFEACFNQPYVKTAKIVFLWAADIYRMTWRYGERGYRDIFLDAGHIGQNLYLSAQAVDAGVCSIGAFNDEKINKIANLDGTKRFIIYAAAIGKLKNEEE